MTDHKFTDDEIIKSLECCIEADCNICPFWKEGIIGCHIRRMREALALINRQKAEIERLERIRAELSRTVESLTNESLTNKCADCAGCAQWVCDCSTIESEAIKEFAERLKKRLERKYTIYGREYVLRHLRDLVKEMTEVDNG